MSASCPQTEPIDSDARRFGRPRRTREAQQAKRFRAELVAHMGGRPSTVQRALIETAVQLKFRLAVMDRAFAETGAMVAHDSRVYLAWSNSLLRVLRQLGMRGVAEKPPSLADYLAARVKDGPSESAA